MAVLATGCSPAACIVGAALAVAACEKRDTTPFAELAGELAVELGVPKDLLLATAYCESRLDPRAAPGVTAGWVKLITWRPDRSPKRAAALLGVPEAEVIASRRTNLRGAAALLGDLAKRNLIAADAPLAAWRPVLEQFEGGKDPIASQLYAEQVLAVVAKGFRIRDDVGQPVELIPARIPVPPSLLAAAPRPAEVVGAAFTSFWPAIATSHRPRPATPRAIKYIIVHSTENSFSTIFAFFRRAGTTVGSHYLIRSFDGMTIQMIDEREVAFHDACFNEETLGIEHEGFVAGGRRWFSDEMYRASAKLVRDIAARYAIPLDRAHILGHHEAPDCSDHTDPGPDWDWDKLMRFIKDPAL